MATIESDVVGNTPMARRAGAWVEAPERVELQEFLAAVNGAAQNASAASVQSIAAAAQAGASSMEAGDFAVTAGGHAQTAGQAATAAQADAGRAQTQAQRAQDEADRAQSIVDNFNPGSDGGGITISTLPPEGIPKEGQQWIMIGDVD